MDNCYGSGDRIPQELLHTQDDRLTNKHVKTLAFLQDIVNENKDLKRRLEELENEKAKCRNLHALAEESQSKIKEIQEKSLARADEINQMLAEEHQKEMMQVLDDKMDMERGLKEVILKLRHEIESLQRANGQLREEKECTEEKKRLEDALAELKLLVEDLQAEVKVLTSEKHKLQKSLEESQVRTSELHQLQDLRAVNQLLTNELREANQKNLEFVYKIEKLERDLRLAATDKEQAELVDAMKKKMEKLLKEKDLAAIKERDMRNERDEVRSENETLQRHISIHEQERVQLAVKYGELFEDYQKLRKRLQQDQDKAMFKEFVALKRELTAVKSENETLRLKVQSTSTTLPMLKEEMPHGAKSMDKKGKKKFLAIT